MATIDDLINFNISTAQQFVFDAAAAIDNINTQKGARGYSFFDIGDGGFDARYRTPDKDLTPTPIYDDSALVFPTTPVLFDVRQIDKPSIPSAPTIDTSGLFSQSPPSNNIPDFIEQDPDLHVDEFLAELRAIEKPVIDSVILPTITPFSIREMPSLQLPDYERPEVPTGLQSPVDYASAWQTNIQNYSDSFTAFANDQVQTWLDKYAPGYNDLYTQLNQRVTTGLSGQVLPDEFESRLMSRNEARINKEFERAELGVVNDPGRRGWIKPPGAIIGGIDSLRTESARSLAGQSTEVYLERRRSEVAFLQVILGLVDNQLSGLRGHAIQFAQYSLSIVQVSASAASSICDQLKQVFEHELSKRNFSLALMQALGQELDIRLKVALSGLESYKLELETISQRTNVETKQIEAAKTILDAQQLKVNLYTALVGAVKEQSFIDELAIKDFSIKADVFNYKTRAVLAGFDAYKAYIEGDKGKLDGELAKLKAYQEQIQAIKLSVDVDSTIAETDLKTNENLLAKFKTEIEGHDAAARTAIQKFTAEKELKSLGLDTYRLDVQTNLSLYGEQVRKELAYLQAKIQAFTSNASIQQEFFRLDQRYADMNTGAQVSVAQAYSNMASAMANATNSSVSIAAQG